MEAKKTIPTQIDSKFRFVLLAAERAEQILRGANPRLSSEGLKSTRVAMNEIQADLVEWDYGPPEEEGSEEAESTES